MCNEFNVEEYYDVVRRCVKSVYYKIGHTSYDMDDLFQEACLFLLERCRIGSFANVVSLNNANGYIWRMCQRRLIRYIVSNRLTEIKTKTAVSTISDFRYFVEYDAGILANYILSSKAISTEDKKMLYRKTVLGEEYSEIAEDFSLKKENVALRCNRAIKKIRAERGIEAKVLKKKQSWLRVWGPVKNKSGGKTHNRKTYRVFYQNGPKGKQVHRNFKSRQSAFEFKRKLESGEIPAGDERDNPVRSNIEKN